MSCMLLSHEDYRNLACSLESLCHSGHLQGKYGLKDLLRSFSSKEYVDTGAKNIARLLYVANYRAFRVRYRGDYVETPFESLKNHLTRPRDCNWHLRCDYAQLVATCKFVHCAIYQCAENGERVKCEDRKMWQHFLELRRVLDQLVLENNPEYNAAPWGDMPLHWVERYKAS